MSEKFFNSENPQEKENFFEEQTPNDYLSPKYRDLEETEKKELRGVLSTLMAPNVFKAALAGTTLFFASPAEAATDANLVAGDSYEAAKTNDTLQQVNLFDNNRIEPATSWEADELIDSQALEQIKQPSAFDREVNKYFSKFTPSEITAFRRLADMSRKSIGGASYAEYIPEVAEFKNPKTGFELPATIQAELTSLLLAQAAKESSLNEKALGAPTPNGERAIGLLQQMPSTIRGEGYSVEKIRSSVTEQIRFASEYMTSDFEIINDGISDQARHELESRHTPEELERDVWPKFILTSYIAGRGRVIKMINGYFSVTENQENELSGNDLVLDMFEYAKENVSGFGKHCSDYVRGIYAFKKVVEPAVANAEQLALND